MGTIYKQGEYYSGGGGSVASIADIADVAIVNPQNNQTLVYNSTTQKWENRAGGGSADLSVIAEPFDDTTEYKEGDYVTYDGRLYVFDVDHEGDWDGEDVTNVTVMDESATPMSTEELADLINLFIPNTMDIPEEISPEDLERIEGAFIIDPLDIHIPEDITPEEEQVLMDAFEPAPPTAVPEMLSPEDLEAVEDAFNPDHIVINVPTDIDLEEMEELEDAFELDPPAAMPEKLTSEELGQLEEAFSPKAVELPEILSPADLQAIEEAFVVHGGGGSGDYEELDNLPIVNGHTVIGDMSLSDLGIQGSLTFDSAPTQGSDNPVTSGGIYTAIYEAIDGVLRASY